MLLSSEGEPLPSAPCCLLSLAFSHLLPWSSLSQALAGEIRREPVHAEGERELAAAGQIMLHHTPDNPSASHVNSFALPPLGEGLPHLFRHPTAHTPPPPLPAHTAP